MSTASRLLPRLAVGASVVVLGAATLAVAPSSTATTPLTATFTVEALTAGNTTDCTVTGGNTTTTNVPYTLGHTTTNHYASSASMVATGNTSDTATVSASGSTTVSTALAGGTLSTVKVTGSGSRTINAALGTSTTCNPEGIAEGGVELTFTLTSPRWITITTSLSNDDVGAAVTTSSSTDHGELHVLAIKGTTSEHQYLAPGDYDIDLEGLVGGSVFGPSPFTGNGTLSGSYALAGALTVPGVATSGVKGDKKVASLPGSVSCSTHKATITWGKDAAKAGKATVKIDGKKPKTTKKPKSGKTHAVSGLPGTGPVTVSVKAGSKTVSRTYEACA